jgi:hypothetical protein
VCLVGTALTDLDLAIDAFMDHPVRTRGAHVAVPEKNRVWGFDDLKAMLVPNQAARRNGHYERERESVMNGVESPEVLYCERIRLVNAAWSGTTGSWMDGRMDRIPGGLGWKM